MRTFNKFQLLPAVLVVYLMMNLTANSQVPYGFNYQALAIDQATGNPISSTPLTVRISLQTTLAGGTLLWQETHAVTTDELGAFSIVIGSGTKSDGTVAAFQDIDWSAGAHFIKTEIKKDELFVNMGTTQFWSVPYSLVAGKLGGSVSRLSVAGSSAGDEEALFEVKNTSGQVIFAVYNSGVRINVDDLTATKGKKGGFAIGGFTGTKGPVQDLFIVNSDSIRGYIGTSPVKGTKGGFAIGGFGPAKAQEEEYLRVTRDSTKIKVNTSAVKGNKGGFAIGGFGGAKGGTDFLNLTKDNYFIGENSGSTNKDGRYNSFIGYEAGKFNLDGSNNIFLGYYAGYSNTNGYENIFIGRESGYKNMGSSDVITGSMNIFLGTVAGYNNTTGLRNIFIGSASGYGNDTGEGNVFMGVMSGYGNKAGGSNIFMGPYSGYNNNNGSNNIFLGGFTGQNNSTGNDNVFIGPQAGNGNTTGNGNLYLGHIAGFTNTVGSQNTVVGDAAGSAMTEGSNNVIIGATSGQYTLKGNNNVYIGAGAGRDISEASGNIFIGHNAGNSETGSNKLIIQNTMGAPLIQGDFEKRELKLNGAVSIGDVANIAPRSTPPPAPAEGDLFFDKNLKKLMLFDGTFWNEITMVKKEY